jgi:type IV pilus assembly protein PilM
MPLAELREAVRWESKRHISYPLESAIIEFLILGEKQERTVDKYDVLFVAAEHDTVVRHLSPFNQAKLSVAAVDANPLALRNTLRIREMPADENTLFIDMGAGKTEINIFRSGALRFSRCLDTGGADMTRVVAEELSIGTEEAEALKKKTDVSAAPDADRAAMALRAKLDGILLEVRRSVEYYKTIFREKSVESAILTGGVALMPGIRDYFARGLETGTEIDDPFAGCSAREDILREFGSLSPRFSAALGLALRKA